MIFIVDLNEFQPQPITRAECSGERRSGGSSVQEENREKEERISSVSLVRRDLNG